MSTYAVGVEVLNLRVLPPEDSLHVVTSSPEFAWSATDFLGGVQTWAEFEVGTNDDWDVAEMWTAPIINGPDTVLVYAGAALMDGMTYWARVRTKVDGFTTPWHTTQFHMNRRPTPPVQLLPIDGYISVTSTPLLTVENAVDLDEDSLTYEFVVSSDSELTQIAATDASVPEDISHTSWTSSVLALENHEYWWRCRATDGFEVSEWSTTRSFWLNEFNEPPAIPVLLEPPDSMVIFSVTPVFDWDDAADADPGDTVEYTLIVAADPAFVFKAEIHGLISSIYAWDYPLTRGMTYWWKAVADDGRGGVVASGTWRFRLADACECPYQCDLNSDGMWDARDLVPLIDHIFYGGPTITDPTCPISRSDINGDGITDAVDINGLVDLLFFGGSHPYDPCGN